MNFSTVQASCPTGESLSPYASVCGRVVWICRYPAAIRPPNPQLPQSTLQGLGHVLGLDLRQHPADSGQGGRVGRDVRADDAFGIVDAEVTQYAGSDVATVGAVSLVPEAVHQLHPGLGHPGELHPGVREPGGKFIPGSDGTTTWNASGRIAAVAAGDR